MFTLGPNANAGDPNDGGRLVHTQPVQPRGFHPRRSTTKDHVLFRRTKSSTTAEENVVEEASDDVRPQGKGRPTPSRREAEAAAKERARAAKDPKAQKRRDRERRTAQNQRMREAMKSGDDRHLPARDKGPMRRFVRDYVDSRFGFVELVLPILLVTMVLVYSGNAAAAAWGNTIMMSMILLVIVDLLFFRFRLKRELTRRFPDESQKGLVYYGITRSLQMKFLRLPKAQVKIGQKLTDRYR